MKWLATIIVVLFFGCASTKNIKPSYINPAQKISAAQNLIYKTINNFPNETEFAVAIIKNKSVSYYGTKRENDTLKLIKNQNNVFEIGSITKIFTTHLFINTLNNGLINSIDNLVNNHTDFKIYDNRKISFKQLANHTSGLMGDVGVSIFKAQNPYKNFDVKRLKKELNNKKSYLNKPGEKYRYSNIGMGLLSQSVCSLNNKSFENLLQEQIFKPLKMQNSTTDKSKVKTRLVQGYNWKGKSTSNWDFGVLEGAGAILSTVEDLAQYAQYNFIQLKADLAIMTQPSYNIKNDLAVGLGWHIKTLNNNKALWHNGGTGGYKSSMLIDYENEIAVIVLTNVGARNNPKKRLIDQLSFDLLENLYR